MDITRRKVVYREGEVTSSSIEGKREIPLGWLLPIKKQGVVVSTFDFSSISERPKLVRMFMTAITGLSSKRGLKTLEQYVWHLTNFWDFLGDMELAGLPLYETKQIDTHVVKNYIVWLNGHKEWSVPAQYYYYSGIKSLLHWLKRHHKKDLAAEIDFPRNPFPRKNAQAVHRPAYSSHITTQLEKAMLSDIEKIKKRIDSLYVKTGKGVDPRGKRNRNGLWKDFDNMVWYFENILDCQCRSSKWLYGNGHSSFVAYACKYNKGLDNTWDDMGVWHGTTQQILIPFVLLFTYLSGANPTPILTMRRDCIKQHPTMDRKFLVLQKNRGGNASYKIKHSIECISIVERVLEITKDLAQEADDDVKAYLWIYRSVKDGKVKHLGMGVDPLSNLFAVMKPYVKKHDIRDESGSPLKLNLARQRPTFATRMFLKTKGDIVKVKALMNHEWISTTMPYISSAGMDDMRENAANDLANHEKKLRAQVAVGDVASELGISKEETVKILSGEYDTYLGKCRDLLNSPLQGEKKGRSCTRFNSCLKCPNCVITADDLHRIFSYYNHINRLRKFMPSDLFGKTYGWVIQAIDEVSAKFKPDTVEEARAKALSDPFPAWDIKLGLAESLEKTQEGNYSNQDGCDTDIPREVT